jgi:hypothetical protein
MAPLPLLAVALMLGTFEPQPAGESCRNVLGHMINGDGAHSTVTISERGRCLESLAERDTLGTGTLRALLASASRAERHPHLR